MRFVHPRFYSTEILPGVFRIRTAPLIWFHLLVEGRRAVVVDTGLLPIHHRIDRVLRGAGLDLSSVDTILLTHGHLDHNGNTRHLVQMTGARVLAPRDDRLHVEFRYPYTGLSRFCGWVETLGAGLLRIEPPSVDHWFVDGEELAVWEDLRAVSLPGHSAGHCGFYSQRRGLLLSGDLFTWWTRPRQPPPWFSLDRDEIWRSIRKAAELNPRYVAANHGFVADPQRQAEALRRLARRAKGVKTH